MSEPKPYPSLEVIKEAYDITPTYMFPSMSPFVVIWEGGLSNDECDAIIEKYMSEEPYDFTGCAAITRECDRPLDPVLNSVRKFGLDMNKEWWQFVLADNPGAWLQTYELGDSYQLHTDGTMGQTRKLTVVAMLTDPSEYDGGELGLVYSPGTLVVPKTRGTMCALPSWVLHGVTPVEQGIRQTLNLGFWGPKFM